MANHSGFRLTKINSLIATIFVLGLTASPFFLQAQNYQQICSPQTTYYAAADNLISAFRRDSAFASGTALEDTTFYSYITIQNSPSGTCYDTKGGSVLGRRIFKRHDGWFFFFNNLNDTVFINTQALVGQSWKFCDLPGGSYLWATVVSQEPGTVLGQPEIFKVISLQAKNSSNTNISNPFNQKQIRLGKNYGLATTYNLYRMPADTTLLSLIGKTYLSIGLSDMSWQKIYDYDIDDEFHYSGYVVTSNYAGNWKSQYRVLSKTVFGNNDSVHYLMEFCQHKVWFNPNSTSDIHDTILLRYDWNLLNNDTYQWSPKLLLPHTFKPYGFEAGLYFQTTSGFNARHQIVNQHRYYKENYPTCWNISPLTHIIRFEFAEGIGRLLRFEQAGVAGSFALSYDSLVFFKKGAETWGVPVTTTCDIVNIRPASNRQPFQAHIFPNPAEGLLLVNIVLQTPSDVKIILVDQLGHQVYSQCKEVLNTGNKLFEIATDRLSPGIYFLTILVSDTLLTKKIVVR